MLLVYHLNLARQVAPVDDRRGGDDVPREEYWEKRKPAVIRDATLDSVLKQAYDKAMGRLPAVETVIALDEWEGWDGEADDEEVLMLMMG